MIKPWLLFPSNWGHKMSPFFLKALGAVSPYKTLTWNPLTWKNLEFTNRLGTAGGFDKNGDLIGACWSLGAGFVEVGTVTPAIQGPNPGKTIDRSISQKALWNQLGFPSKGADYVANQLKKYQQPHFTPIFVNIGKNRSTSLQNASLDYIELIKKLSIFADAFVINISSPNTPQLRDLLQPTALKAFLIPILQFNREYLNKPILLKLSPDIEINEFKTVLDISAELKIDGWILTNTTLQRNPLLHFPKTGGVSGRPLSEISKQCLKTAVEHLGSQKKDFLFISTGGVFSASDISERLDMGADLIQIYSAFIFEGPFLFSKIHKKFS